jgi:Transglycosylase
LKIDLHRFKKYGITLAKIVGVFFLLAVISFFAFRNFLLNKAVEKVAAKFHHDYQTTFTVGNASFKGISGVDIQNIIIIPEGKDTIVTIGNLESSVRLWYALILDFRIKELLLKNGYINLVKNNSGRNFDVFLKHKNKDSLNIDSTTTKQTNYAEVVYRLISKVLAQIPNEMLVENFALRITDDNRKESFNMKNLSLHDEQLTSNIEVTTNTFSQRWHINGFASTKNKKADVEFYNADTGKVRIPYIDERFHLITGFDSVHLNLESVEMNGDELEIKGVASVTDFLINHPKISKKDVVIDHAEFKYRYLIGSHFISLDSSSSIQFNSINFHPYIRFQKSPDTVFQFSVRTEKTQAQQFIDALPEGLFTHFKGMEAEGNFTYSLDFIYNQNHPDDLIFESNLKKENLKIVKYGEANLSKLNGEFIYTPIEKDRPQRPIFVGTANPFYTPSEQISPFLKSCILTSEDPSFFYHRGFIDEAFRQSIIKNIQTRKFSRGASTISMQLIKNVFLTREKTVSRKLEEILLVYILENNHLSTKERMFEVYLNIIEWGPNVYGIGEASKFYFNKRPANLTLDESLFLATIIPRPKGFMWRFEKDGTIKDFASKQFKFLSDIMVRRNLITPIDTIGFSSKKLLISGAAKKLIVKTDSLVNDSILIDENGLLREVE